VDNRPPKSPDTGAAVMVVTAAALPNIGSAIISGWLVIGSCAFVMPQALL
jgi:hypothetical protein